MRNIISLDNYLRIQVIQQNSRLFLPKLNISAQTRFVFEGEEYTYVEYEKNNFQIENSYFLSIDVALKELSSKKDRDALLYFIKHIKEIKCNQDILDGFDFIEALKKGDLNALSHIPKSDLHNHTPLGGSRTVLKELSGKHVPKLNYRFKTIPEMNKWCDDNIKSPNDYCNRVRACFIQAQRDGIKVFAPNIATCAKKNFNSLNNFFHFIYELIDEFSDSMAIYPELALDRNKYSDDLEDLVIQFLNTGLFYSIDLTGDESLGVENFKKIYSIAEEYGMIKKAHVGEFSNADVMYDAIINLNLDTVQHGITAIENKELMKYLIDNKISLTICPSSNYFLSRIESISKHPLRDLYHSGIQLSVCSDDILVFDSSVSNEYKILYENGVLNAFELNCIRMDGLNFYMK